MSELLLNSSYLSYCPQNGEKYNSSRLMYFQPNISEKNKKLKILVALNGKHQKIKLSNVLEEKKCKIDFAQNGWFCVQEAHNKKVIGKPYDLAILSVDLKVLDGFTVAAKLHSLDLVKNIIITSKDKFYSYETDSLISGGATFLVFSDLLKILDKA